MSDANLWPHNLDEETPPDVPKDTLERAAQELDQLTAGKVVGEVRTRGIGDKLEYSFYLSATQVNYRYFMFKVRRGIDDFPLELIYSDDKPPQQIATPDAFEDELRQLFNTPQTRSVVNRLRNLAREVG